jgi:hypothetical protein
MFSKKQFAAFILSGNFAAVTFIGCAPKENQAAETRPAAEAKSTEATTPYVLNTCPVSDEKLGEMGEPYVFTHAGREIKLCCKSCLKDFNKEPAKFIQKIEAAEKTAKKI